MSQIQKNRKYGIEIIKRYKLDRQQKIKKKTQVMKNKKKTKKSEQIQKNF